MHAVHFLHAGIKRTGVMQHPEMQSRHAVYLAPPQASNCDDWNDCAHAGEFSVADPAGYRAVYFALFVNGDGMARLYAMGEDYRGNLQSNTHSLGGIVTCV